MRRNDFQRVRIFLLLLVLTIPALQTDLPAWNGWQGTGSMTESNMTEIQTTLANNPVLSTPTSVQMDAIAQIISLHLNELWAPAWNVVITKCPLGYDSVVYGYAFRNHWMWINGATIPGSTTVLAYLIWKDYNCHTWSVFSNFLASASTLTAGQSQTIGAYAMQGIQTNVWGAAFSFVDYLNTQTSTNSGAYTIVLSQHPTAVIRGHVCLVNKNYFSLRNVQTTGTGTYGAYFLFQTR